MGLQTPQNCQFNSTVMRKWALLATLTELLANAAVQVVLDRGVVQRRPQALRYNYSLSE